MRGLISPTSQYCRENVLDTGSGRLDRDHDTAGRCSSLEGGGSCPCSGSRDNISSPSRRRRSSMQTALGLALLVVIVCALVVGVRYISGRRKRIEETMILQSQLSDFVAREPQLQSLVITPRARVSG